MVSLVSVFLYSLISLGVYGQAPWNSVLVCATPCSDGSTYAACTETFGGISPGDCSWFQTCPEGLSQVGTAYDLGAGRGWSFSSVEACEKAFNKLRQKPNKPVIVSDKVTPVISTRGTRNDLHEALQWHSDFSFYSAEEQLLLGQIVVAGNQKTRDRSYSDEKLRSIAHGAFNFVRNVRETTSNKTGVYTNSKCAGCSLIVQSIDQKAGSAICDSIASVIKGSICGTNPVFEIFCDAATSAVGFDEVLESTCLNLFDGIVSATGIRDRANYICSTLTCTSQKAQITSEDDIMGSCDLKQIGGDTRSLNERCDELIRICDLAEKGLCIKNSLNEIEEMVEGGFVKAGVQTVLNLVNGKLPPALDVAKEAAKCSKAKCGGDDDDDEDSAIMAKPVLSLALVAVFVLFILSHF